MNFNNLPDDELNQLIEAAKLEQARRNSKRRTSLIVSRLLNKAFYAVKSGKAADIDDVNWKLAKIGARVVAIDGRVYLEGIRNVERTDTE